TATDNIFTPGSDVGGDYTYSIEGTASCPGDEVVVSVTVNELISVLNLNEDCTPDNLDFVVSFEISGGDAGSYTVIGVNGTLSPGNPATFVSDPIPQGTTYNLTVEDANACNSIEISGNVDCSCLASANISGNAEICEGESANLTFTFSGNGPFDVVYSDGTSNYNLNGVLDGYIETVTL